MYQFGNNVVPGWRVHRGDDGIVRIVLNGSAAINVTSVDGSPVAHDVLFAMAAAPEMYEALRNLAYTMQAASAYIPPQNVKLRDEYEVRTRLAYEAIRKAEGRGE